jgi:hypothetical protein
MVAADRLVRAWMSYDTIAALQLTRDDAPVEGLFSEHVPTSTPRSRLRRNLVAVFVEVCPRTTSCVGPGTT